MPRGVRYNVQDRESKRHEVIEAAIPLFVRNGFSRTTISEIAREAGMSHGTVFLYFSSKDDLFSASLLEPLVEFERLICIMTQGEEGLPPVEQVRELVKAHISAFSSATTRNYLQLTQYVLGQRDRFPELTAHLLRFSERFCDELEPVITRGQALRQFAPGNARTIALSYFAYLNGLALTILGDDKTLWEELASNGLRLFGLIE